jgi:agmatinase
MKLKLSNDIVSVSNDNSKILNTKTGEEFVINQDIILLISEFKELNETNKYLDSFPPEERQIVETFIDELTKNNILVSENNRLNEFDFLVDIPTALTEKPVDRFFSAPYKSESSLVDKTIAFLGVPFDQATTGLPGARFGPDTIRKITQENYDFHTDVFTGLSKGWFSTYFNENRIKNQNLADIGNILVNVGESFEDVYTRITKVLNQIYSTNSFPVVIGGDHSVTYSIIKSYKETINEKISIIHFDAHSDIGSYCKDIPHNHGNVMSRILYEDLVEQIYHFGVRTSFDSSIEKSSIYQGKTVIEFEDLLNKMDPNIKYHLSFDIDIIDPSQAPGTGTPVPNGMTLDKILPLLQKICERFDIASLDLVEVNPMVDLNNITSITASALLFHLLSCLFS